MDDASGNYFGRQLLRDYYFNRIPESIAEKFKENFELDAETIKDHLYKKPNPNTYLAKFARFLIENKGNEYAQGLIKKVWISLSLDKSYSFQMLMRFLFILRAQLRIT